MLCIAGVKCFYGIVIADVFARKIVLLKGVGANVIFGFNVEVLSFRSWVSLGSRSKVCVIWIGFDLFPSTYLHLTLYRERQNRAWETMRMMACSIPSTTHTHSTREKEIDR